MHAVSGAGTNLKVHGGTVRSESGGADPAQSAGKNFWSCPSTFWLYISTISRFGERFRDGQYNLVSFLFAVLLLAVPPVPSYL